MDEGKLWLIGIISALVIFFGSFNIVGYLTTVENKGMSSKGYCQEQMLGTSGTFWTKCNCKK